ncbi:MAG: malto-oligosyltrehalose trehalohydrolase [Desulfobaccales bacterium]
MLPQPLRNLGAIPLREGSCSFRVWAPRCERLEVRLVAPGELLVPLQKGRAGYFQGVVAGVGPGARYFYRLDGAKDRPDPASRFQPEGVHGPSQVAAAGFAWEDQGWCGPDLRDYAIYELHVGAYSPEGTLAAIIPHLEELRELGITALELMPVAQFPGNRNWGYDGVYPFAVQNSYGGPEALKRLVNACHRQGLAVILDVVYNHLGPEGNYLWDYGFYFTGLYRTPWGDAVNFDGPYSDEVRRFFIENALYWLDDCHVDALRLDGLHAIMDRSPRTFLEELAQAVHTWGERSGRRVYLMAESDLNDVRLIRTPELGGCGLDAHWNEDFHHALHTLLTGEKDGYYQDFGELGQMAKGFREGFIYSGEYSPYRQRRHGSSSRGLPARRFIVFAQNHDQVGNRALGERLTQLLSFEALKLAAGVIILSPFIPFLFMGEEYGEVAPFQYFISHTDPELVDAVRRGRREEFAGFLGQAEPPDPASEETFQRSKLNHSLRQLEPHRVLWDFYRELLGIRRNFAGLSGSNEEDRQIDLFEKEKALLVRCPGRELETALLINFGGKPASLSFSLPGGRWDKVLDSAEARWRGPGSPAPGPLQADGEISVTLAPQSLVLLARREEI